MLPEHQSQPIQTPPLTGTQLLESRLIPLPLLYIILELDQRFYKEPWQTSVGRNQRLRARRGDGFQQGFEVEEDGRVVGLANGAVDGAGGRF